jgi:NADH-quinone oxidoreductase subunit G/NADP-reducing hydrogenase subunit HndD
MTFGSENPYGDVTLLIDEIEVTVPRGTSVLNAARMTGIIIPTLCDHELLKPRAVCRLCVVEVDGGGRLKAACATEVSEGARVITNSPDLRKIRKTIVELLLADHPDDCFVCPRNLDCELQNLADKFGIRKKIFEKESSSKEEPILLDAGTLSRDMNKCVKCGRCVALCGELQDVTALTPSMRSRNYRVSSPFEEELRIGPCVFCGECASVCPVGAISEKDDTDAALNMANPGGGDSAAISSPGVALGVEDALSYPEGFLSPGKMVSALKRLGFKKIYPREFYIGVGALGEAGTVLERMERGEKPLISLCSAAARGFFREYYPSLVPLILDNKSPGEIFGAMSGEICGEGSVSFHPCLAHKFEKTRAREGGDSPPSLALTVRELVRLFKSAGFNFNDLPDLPFDDPLRFKGVPSGSSGGIGEEELPIGQDHRALAGVLYGLFRLGEGVRPFSGGVPSPARRDFERVLPGGRTVKLTVTFGMAAAGKVAREILGGTFLGDYLRVMSCPFGCASGGGQVKETVSKLRGGKRELPRGEGGLPLGEGNLSIGEGISSDLFRERDLIQTFLRLRKERPEILF